MRILVTGGAGFIGSALIRYLLGETHAQVVNVDLLTYAGNRDSLSSVDEGPRYAFEHVDIRDGAALDAVFERHRPNAVMHLAAESHVDRSIDAPGEFLDTNLIGTGRLLQATLGYWKALEPQRVPAVSVSACVDRRSVWRPRGLRGLHERHPMHRARPTPRQGGLGSSGARVAPHI